ncbi:MAG: phage tail protein [Proteobacteria bacterium]|nr:phage tail protein [Pseudomonadota bacterium]
MTRRIEMDPLVNFSFTVDINGINVARFNGVDGLNYEVEMIEYRSSDKPNLPQFRQGRKKAARVTFKRGVLVGSGNNLLLNWLREVESKSITRRDVSVTIGDYGGDETSGGQRTWQLIGCLPSKWNLSSLDSNSNSAAIENLELVVEEVRQ